MGRLKMMSWIKKTWRKLFFRRKNMFPEIRRIYPSLISSELVSVIPMGPPNGLFILFGNPDASKRVVLFEKYKPYNNGLFYLDCVYDIRDNV